MLALTNEARELLIRMRELGWSCYFECRPLSSQWTFQKFVATRDGDFWRSGSDEDVAIAGEKALVEEGKARAKK